MLTVYLVLYSLLAITGIIEIATGWLIKPLGMGAHAFFLIFTVIFIIQIIVLIRRRNADPETKQRVTSDAHRLSIILATLLLLIVGLFAL